MKLRLEPAINEIVWHFFFLSVASCLLTFTNDIEITHIPLSTVSNNWIIDSYIWKHSMILNASQQHFVVDCTHKHTNTLIVAEDKSYTYDMSLKCCVSIFLAPHKYIQSHSHTYKQMYHKPNSAFGICIARPIVRSFTLIQICIFSVCLNLSTSVHTNVEQFVFVCVHLIYI